MSAQNGTDSLPGGADATGDDGALNSFRSYCSNAANLLKTSLYQMSSATVSPGKPLSAKDDLVGGIFASLGGSGSGSSIVGGGSGGGSGVGTGPVGMAQGYATGSGVGSVGTLGGSFGNGADAAAAAADADESLELQRLSASGQLTQSIYNLRGWLAVTIVQRLDAEISRTNRALSGNTHADCRGFTDVQVGKVGLERLRKTAELPQLVGAHVPMLPKIVEFVQVTSNQEYLVQRLRELARGCVLAEYRWNGGGTYDGVLWDEHLRPMRRYVAFSVWPMFAYG